MVKNQAIGGVKVISMEWERVLLHIDVEIEYMDVEIEKLDFYLINEKKQVKAYFQVRQLEDGSIRLTLNITNIGNCRCLEEGRYAFVMSIGDKAVARLKVAPSYVTRVIECSRQFMHHEKQGYLIDFSVVEIGDDLYLSMGALQVKKESINYLDNKAFRKGIKNEGKRLLRENVGRMFWRKYYWHYAKKYAKKEKVVLFLTEQGDFLRKNLTSVMEEMRQKGLEGEYTIKTSARPASYKNLPRKSMANFLKLVAQANYIFLDDHVPTFDWMMLSKKTTVVQLWHAGAGFKSAGYSRWGHKGCPAPIGCHRQYRYGVAGSEKIAHFFAEVFGINEEQILPTGMPRMDEYNDLEYRNNKIEELYVKYPLCKEKKVILFAPTYRGVKRADAYYPYELIDFDELYGYCESEGYVVVFKMHPWVSQPVPIIEKYKNRFIDAGASVNINDLFYITDILISDYSSNIYEYSLMKKPMLFFAFDKVSYSVTRGFHRDYDQTAPGKVCETFEELMCALKQKDYQYEKVEKYIEEQFNQIDSQAASRVIDWIIMGNMPENIRRKEKERLEKRRRMEDLQLADIEHLL